VIDKGNDIIIFIYETPSVYQLHVFGKDRFDLYYVNLEPETLKLGSNSLLTVEARKTYDLTPQLALNNTCVLFNGDLLHTYDNYFDSTVYIQQ